MNRQDDFQSQLLPSYSLPRCCLTSWVPIAVSVLFKIQTSAVSSVWKLILLPILEGSLQYWPWTDPNLSPTHTLTANLLDYYHLFYWVQLNYTAWEEVFKLALWNNQINSTHPSLRMTLLFFSLSVKYPDPFWKLLSEFSQKLCLYTSILH